MSDDWTEGAANAVNGLIGLAIVGIFKGLFGLAGYANGWRDAECAGCGAKLRVNAKKHGNPPYYCTDCADTLERRQRTVDLFRAELIPKGWESSLVRPPDNKQLGDKGVMLFKGKGTNGEDYRVTWRGQGEAHWTDQGLPDHHPNAHRDPRK